MTLIHSSHWEHQAELLVPLVVDQFHKTKRPSANYCLYIKIRHLLRILLGEMSGTCCLVSFLHHTWILNKIKVDWPTKIHLAILSRLLDFSFFHQASIFRSCSIILCSSSLRKVPTMSSGCCAIKADPISGNNIWPAIKFPMTKRITETSEFTLVISWGAKTNSVTVWQNVDAAGGSAKTAFSKRRSIDGSSASQVAERFSWSSRPEGLLIRMDLSKNHWLSSEIPACQACHHVNMSQHVSTCCTSAPSLSLDIVCSFRFNGPRSPK